MANKTLEQFHNENNVYVGDYRACHIAGKWRILKRNPDRINREEWLFVNEQEYDTANDALECFVNLDGF